MGNPYAPKPPGTPTPPTDQERRPEGPPPGAWDDGSAHEHEQRDGPRRAGRPGGRPARPPREPVDPEVLRRLTRPLMVFTLLLLACLLLSSAPLPWRMTSVGFAVAALVAGLLALRRAWRAQVRGMLVAAVAAGMAVALTLGLATLAVIPVWDIEMDRQTCMSEAITHSARSACLTAYKTSLEEFQDSLTR